VYLRKVNVTRFQILGWRQPGENSTYAIEHCEPFTIIVLCPKISSA
jgi:hypothetical protein